MKPDTTVLYLADDITLLHSLLPFLWSSHRSRFSFTTTIEEALHGTRRQNLILLRFYKRREIAGDRSVFQALRDRYRRMVYFDDTATADEINTLALDLCDFYAKKQMRRDRESYEKPLYGKRSFSDHYHRNHGITDVNEEIRQPIMSSRLSQIDISWNLGIGVVPRTQLRRALAFRLDRVAGPSLTRLVYRGLPSLPPLTGRSPCISARFGSRFDSNTVAHHRKLFSDAVTGREEYLTGRTTLRAFNRELAKCRGVLSPFGWGEVCFRDFEGIAKGAVLIKPSMDHIETWPNVYVPGETYIPVGWDATDLQAAEAIIRDDDAECVRIARRAYDVYAGAFDQAPRRADTLLEKWLG